MKLSKIEKQIQQADNQAEAQTASKDAAQHDDQAEKQNAKQDQQAGEGGQADKETKQQAAKVQKGAKENKKLDPLLLFQTLEWHALTLAGAKMDEDEKKQRLDGILDDLSKAGADLKAASMKTLGVSPQTVDQRLELTKELVEDVLKSDKRYDIDPAAMTNGDGARHMLNKYEASEWKLLEQGKQAKDSVKNQNLNRRENDQADLFKAAENYFGASTDLAQQSEKIGIPKDIVKKRSEQRLRALGEDPDLKDMRNPSDGAAMITGSAAFMYFVKQLIEKMARAIKEMAQLARQKTNVKASPEKPAATAAARPS